MRLFQDTRSGTGAPSPELSRVGSEPDQAAAIHDEIERSALARDSSARVGGHAVLEPHVATCECRHNGASVKADWQFTTADARIKPCRLYLTVQG